MGGALAERLQLTHSLVVHDRSEAAVGRLTANGATAASSLSDVAEHCDTIFLCLPTSDHVRSVLFGDEGLASSLKPGTIVIDQTTGDPNATREMAETLKGQGVDLVDAPVSGGAQGARAGTIAIMVGATDEQYGRIQPILEAISPNLFHAGDVGNGHVVKLVNNLLSHTQRLLSFEAISLAAKNGVEPKRALEILQAGGGRNAFLEKRMPHIVAGNLDCGFTLGLAHKDVRLATQLGTDSGVPMLFGGLTRELYQLYMSDLGRDTEVDTASLVMDRWAGTAVVPGAKDPNTGAAAN
jgi:3-hydroxyisobutyrate dehydrogenase